MKLKTKAMSVAKNKEIPASSSLGDQSLSIILHSAGLQLEHGAYLLLHASYKNIGILLLLKEPHPSL